MHRHRCAGSLHRNLHGHLAGIGESQSDWKRVALINLNQWSSETDPEGLNYNTGRIFVKAGPHQVSA